MIDVAPLFGLGLRTPRLELRLGRAELEALARVAAGGIHGPDEMPSRAGRRSSTPLLLAAHDDDRGACACDPDPGAIADIRERAGRNEQRRATTGTKNAQQLLAQRLDAMAEKPRAGTLRS